MNAQASCKPRDTDKSPKPRAGKKNMIANAFAQDTKETKNSLPSNSPSAARSTRYHSPDARTISTISVTALAYSMNAVSSTTALVAALPLFPSVVRAMYAPGLAVRLCSPQESLQMRIGIGDSDGSGERGVVAVLLHGCSYLSARIWLRLPRHCVLFE
jgi:hypothetical protein